MRFILAASVSVLSLALASPASAMDLSFHEALTAAEGWSGSIRSAAAAVRQARDTISVQRATVLPNLEFHGSSDQGSASAAGISPFLSQAVIPFKIGPSGGLASNLDLKPMNFIGVWAAYKDLKTAKAQYAIARYQVDQQVINYYFLAAMDRALRGVWKEIEENLLVPLEARIKFFVANGQVNPQDLYLLRDQIWIARYSQTTYDMEYRYSVKQLAVLMGVNTDGLSVPTIDDIDTSSGTNLAPFSLGSESPFISHAVAAANAADVRVKQYTAQFLPELDLRGAYGDFDGLSPGFQHNLAGFLQIRVPIFEGLSYYSQRKRAKHVYEQTQYAIRGSRIYVGEGNVQFDKLSAVSQAQLYFYLPELQTDMNAYNLSRKRYLSFRGPLVDVREAIRDIAATRTNIETARELLWANKLSKIFFNGARPKTGGANLEPSL